MSSSVCNGCETCQSRGRCAAASVQEIQHWCHDKEFATSISHVAVPNAPIPLKSNTTGVQGARQDAPSMWNEALEWTSARFGSVCDQCDSHVNRPIRRPKKNMGHWALVLQLQPTGYTFFLCSLELEKVTGPFRLQVPHIGR